ncbi:cob(I)yrinic acid a,c-diamide adenosyltransferase [Yersinia aldovae]|uniref:Corrinoid adenosyltransferase n=1 Tax=Yersinia aldovae TaxID=29483 RepID=A0A0T9U561_YERAL|nr:cob(I)yrinic acid a,c-diamide adenosyltransferase [Yersinia aldovae]EEP96404.1 Cob(I)yrinic acid a,c-diamide adenosyltransferase [Yersinia aldovae ATCC 35236]CNL20279.1 cob(i)alamin adenosyltransferase [Yersinia aldovae]CNL66654.1 cob(i)alamin adenosyltransferase [Yersinia aldovae]
MHEKRYQQRQQRIKDHVKTRVADAAQASGIIMIFTGNGKGKTTAAFGTATRAVGHGMRVGVIQFIKGTWESGERNLLERHGVAFHIMATGFTWDTQDKAADTLAAKRVWEQGCRMLSDPSYELVVLDELTYMVAYGYLALDEVIVALKNRPKSQSVVITGRACHRDIIDLADTVSELRPVKHAFDSGIKAQKGIDW